MGEGSRSATSSAPFVYWVAWPGSVELLVGAKIFFAAVCNMLGGGNSWDDKGQWSMAGLMRRRK